MFSKTTIDLIRHGSPAGGRLYRGSSIDDELSDKGWAQMREAAESVQTWQQIISSPMQRCSAFAEWLSKQRNIPLSIEHDLREVGFGSWEGLSPDEIIANNGNEYADFYDDPVNNRPKGAEPLDIFGKRVSQVIEQTIKQHQGAHILMVCHAGVVRAALGHVLQAPALNWYRAKVDNASILRLQQTEYGLTLIHHNK